MTFLDKRSIKLSLVTRISQNRKWEKSFRSEWSDFKRLMLNKNEYGKKILKQV